MWIVRVSVERHGGFMGIPATTVVDAASLPAGEQDEVERLVQAAGFFGAPHSSTHGRPEPDRFEYLVTVLTSDDATNALRAGEAELTEELRQLIAFVQSKGTRFPGKP